MCVCNKGVYLCSEVYPGGRPWPQDNCIWPSKGGSPTLLHWGVATGEWPVTRGGIRDPVVVVVRLVHIGGVSVKVRAQGFSQSATETSVWTFLPNSKALSDAYSKLKSLTKYGIVQIFIVKHSTVFVRVRVFSRVYMMMLATHMVQSPSTLLCLNKIILQNILKYLLYFMLF